MKPFAIAGIQMNLSATEPNVEAMCRKLDLLRYLHPWVQMVLFSELAPYGPALRHARSVPGPVEDVFREAAARHGIWLLPGSLLTTHEGKIYNTAPVIAPDGAVVTRYRKMFPFPPGEEGVEAGDEPVVFDVAEVGRFGVSICHDMWFPETTRTLAAMGAEVILHPSATPAIDRPVELAIATASAAIHQCFFFDVNGLGAGGAGYSIVVGPAGNVLHQAGSAEETILVEIDLDRVRRSREAGLRGHGERWRLASRSELPKKPPEHPRGRSTMGNPIPGSSNVRRPPSGGAPLPPRKLVGLADVRRFFVRNQDPVFFEGVSDFSLLKMTEWVGRYRRYLVEHPENHAGNGSAAGTDVFFFDEKAAELAASLKSKLGSPPAALREQASVEACVTRAGTAVGPLTTELVGIPELTPYRDEWCGSEVFAGAFPREVREQARETTVDLGEKLSSMGYRGYFEVDYLIDRAGGRVHVGEINPRVGGAGSMADLAAFAHAAAPIFLLHLLEYFDVDFDLDVEEINARWSNPFTVDSWSQMVIKHTIDSLDRLVQTPPSGVWRLADDDTLQLLRVQTHQRTVERSNQAFFLRTARPGDYRREGSDLGILLTPTRLMDEDGELTGQARSWIRAICSLFLVEPTGEGDPGVRMAAPSGAW